MFVLILHMVGWLCSQLKPTFVFTEGLIAEEEREKEFILFKQGPAGVAVKVVDEVLS